MIRIREISLPPEHSVHQLPYEAARLLKISNSKVRRLNIVACHVLRETDAVPAGVGEQLDLFASAEDTAKQEEDRRREKCRQKAVLGIQKKYGKNAILKGMNLEEGATARDRNRQIGGHKA